MITTYNSSPFIRETIESVLNQTFSDFELLVGDDCSTDNTCEIVESYEDSRIRLIRCEHNFIETENRLLYEARGKYIARLDHDDRMLPDRLKIQYDYMEAHPEIDALGGGAVCFGAATGKFTVEANRKFTVNDFLKANLIVNPSVMLRRETIVKHNLKYKQRYLYSDDYGFWADMLKLGLHIENIPDILIEYRISPTQASSAHADIQAESANKVVADLEKWVTQKETDRAKNNEICIPDTSNELTVIIPFLNEGEEVARTAASVREFAGDKVDVIVINDHSTDGYGYRDELAPYNVAYIYNMERKGVAASRDLGVELCKTPYFLLLDAHMRFYDCKWPSRIVCALKNNDRQLLCAQTKVLHKRDGIVEEEKTCVHYTGAFIPFNKNNFIPDIEWNVREYAPGEKEENIAAVLGAGYAASKRYWKHLRGLEGLKFYGCDEAYISLKVWLDGGKCVLLKDVPIGHIYREAAPYRGISVEFLYNYMMISYTVFPAFLRCFSYAMALKKDYHVTKKTFELIKERKSELDELRDYYKSIFTCPFDKIIALNSICSVEKEEENKRKLPLLKSIAEHIKGNLSIDMGINHGRMGQLLFLALYAHFSNSAVDFALSEIKKLAYKACAPNASVGITFGDGLAGIGWGLLFLGQELHDTNIYEEHLSAIDREIGKADFSKLDRHDFFKGIGGLCCYIGARMSQARMNDAEEPFHETFLHKIIGFTPEMISPLSDMQTMAYALFLKSVCEDKAERGMKLSVNHWAETADFLPKSEKHWQEGIDGCAGYGMMIINEAIKIKRHGK